MVVWRTGSGKTAGALSILQNFYHDPRPKIIVVPDSNIVDRWMTDLLQYDNLYRTFVIRTLLTSETEEDRRTGHRIHKKMGVDAIQIKRAREILERGGFRGISGYRNEWAKARSQISACDGGSCGVKDHASQDHDFLSRLRVPLGDKVGAYALKRPRG